MSAKTSKFVFSLCLLVAGWLSTGVHAQAGDQEVLGSYGYGYSPPAPTSYGYYPPPSDGGYGSPGLAPSFPGYGGYYQPAYYSPDFKRDQAVQPTPDEPEDSDPEPSSPSPINPTTRSLAECPACPACPTTTPAATSRSTTASQPAAAKAAVEAPVTPAGQCYCPYDSDWDTWALDDSTCRAALKSKCQSDPRLPCAWVESYYTDRTSSNSSTPPHAAELVAYLYNDCPPASPCSCSVLAFTKADSATLKYTCCQDLQIYAAIPYSGLPKTAVDTYCGRNGSPAAIKKWVEHTLWHQNCTGKTTTGVYVYSAEALRNSLQQQSSQAATAGSRPASGDDNSKTVAIAASAAGIGGAAVGALVAAAALTWWARRGAGGSSEYNRLQGDAV